MASLTDNLNWKGYSEIEQLHMTCIQEPIVETY